LPASGRGAFVGCDLSNRDLPLVLIGERTTPSGTRFLRRHTTTLRHHSIPSSGISSRYVTMCDNVAFRSIDLVVSLRTSDSGLCWCGATTEARVFRITRPRAGLRSWLSTRGVMHERANSHFVTLGPLGVDATRTIVCRKLSVVTLQNAKISLLALAIYQDGSRRCEAC